jgi:predicted RNase H-like HicB family nuclease
MDIQFTTQIFKEGRTYVAHTRELDVSSCGGSKQKALRNLKEAVRLFLEEADRMGTLKQILQEACSFGKGACTEALSYQPTDKSR